MTDSTQHIPVIAIDGPSGAGKGTVAMILAGKLGWHLLDSGALYRLLGLACKNNQVDFDRVEEVVAQAAGLDVQFLPGQQNQPAVVMLDGEDVSSKIRTPEVGELASTVGAIPEARAALLARQKAFARAPGLVADGRDMGTVVFPDTPFKFFLTASAHERAQRRYKQLISKGESVNFAPLLADIEARDKRDQERAVAPLRPADDAIVIDSTDMSIDEVVNQILSAVQA